jgi:hypothetical protein
MTARLLAAIIGTHRGLLEFFLGPYGLETPSNYSGRSLDFDGTSWTI